MALSNAVQGATHTAQQITWVDGDGDPLQLRQITGRRNAVTNAVLRLHITAQNNRCRTVGEIERRMPDEYERCLDEVERPFARYPVRLLQVVGREQRPFLYDIDWGQSVTLTALRDGAERDIRLTLQERPKS